MMPPRADARPALASVRPMTAEDVPALLDMERRAFAGIPEDRHWRPEQLLAHLRVFPEGQWVAERDGRVVGSCTNMRTTWERATRPHRWRAITANGTLATHVPDGDVLYGTEIMVHPEARRMGVGRLLFRQRFRFVREHGLRAFVTGGRLPGYRAAAERYLPEEYVAAVARGEATDPVLTPQLKWGLEPRGVLCGYMVDPPSLHHATLAVWEPGA